MRPALATTAVIASLCLLLHHAEALPRVIPHQNAAGEQLLDAIENIQERARIAHATVPKHDAQAQPVQPSEIRFEPTWFRREPKPSPLNRHPSFNRNKGQRLHDLEEGSPLVRNLRVDRYDLHFRFYFPFAGFKLEPERNMTFDAHTRIHFQMSTDAESLQIDQNLLNISAIRLWENAGSGFDHDGEIPLEKVESIPPTRLLIRPKQAGFIRGRTYTLEFVYAGRVKVKGSQTSLVDDDTNGIFASDYKNAKGGRSWLIGTHFETNYAQRLYPCFDDPHFKAVFNVSLDVPIGATALSNGVPRKVEKLDANFQRVSFNPSPRMSSYLLALSIGDFGSHAAYTAKSNVRVEVWSWSEMQPYLAFAANESARCLQELEDFTGVPFPIEKLDIMGVPYLGGAMENYGLILSQISLVAANPKFASIDSLIDVSDVLCHEISHQFFGDLVTTDTWGDLFLNEAFATFFSKFILARANPERALFLDQLFVTTDQERGLSAETWSPIPLANSEANFGSVTYSAGGAILRMIRATLGEETFRQSLHYHLERHAFGNVDNQTLIDAFALFTRRNQLPGLCGGDRLDASEFLEGWIRQPSAPSLQVDWIESEGAYRVTQKPLATPDLLHLRNVSWNVPILHKARNLPGGVPGKDGNETLKSEAKEVGVHWALQTQPESRPACSSYSPNATLINWNSETLGRFLYNSPAFDRILAELDTDPGTYSHSTHFRLLLDAAYDPATGQGERLQKLLRHIFRDIRRSDASKVPSIYASSHILRIITDQGLASDLVAAIYPAISWADSDDWNQRYLQENLLFYIVRSGLPDAYTKGKDLAKAMLKKCVEGKTKAEEVDIYCNDIPPGVRQAAYCAAVRPAGKALDKTDRIPALSKEDSLLKQQLTLYWYRVEQLSSAHYLYDETYRLRYAMDLCDPNYANARSKNATATAAGAGAADFGFLPLSSTLGEGVEADPGVANEVKGFELAKLVSKWARGREPGSTDVVDYPEF